MSTSCELGIALITALLLVASGASAQPGMTPSRPPSTPEGKPAEREIIAPTTRGEVPSREGAAVEPEPVEAPAPGVPVDQRTYRELKEQAKESR